MFFSLLLHIWIDMRKWSWAWHGLAWHVHEYIHELCILGIGSVCTSFWVHHRAHFSRNFPHSLTHTHLLCIEEIKCVVDSKKIASNQMKRRTKKRNMLFSVACSIFRELYVECYRVLIVFKLHHKQCTKWHSARVSAVCTKTNTHHSKFVTLITRTVVTKSFT